MKVTDEMAEVAIRALLIKNNPTDTWLWDELDDDTEFSIGETSKSCAREDFKAALQAVFDHIEKGSALKLIHVEKPIGKFTAFYNDGSGASIFCITDTGELVDAEWDIQEEGCLDNYSHWSPLPDDFEFFGQEKVEQPTDTQDNDGWKEGCDHQYPMLVNGKCAACRVEKSEKSAQSNNGWITIPQDALPVSLQGQLDYQVEVKFQDEVTFKTFCPSSYFGVIAYRIIDESKRCTNCESGVGTIESTIVKGDFICKACRKIIDGYNFSRGSYTFPEDGKRYASPEAIGYEDHPFGVNIKPGKVVEDFLRPPEKPVLKQVYNLKEMWVCWYDYGDKIARGKFIYKNKIEAFQEDNGLLRPIAITHADATTFYEGQGL